jgi:hypothetical protein
LKGQDRLRERDRQRETDRVRDRQRERQRDREADRQRERQGSLLMDRNSFPTSLIVFGFFSFSTLFAVLRVEVNGGEELIHLPIYEMQAIKIL